MDYEAFLASKTKAAQNHGIRDPFRDPFLFPFQADLVQWSLRKGRSAIFADCGLGKTVMQLSWARQIPGPVLVVAPLAVSEQTQAEGEKFGIPAKVSRTQPNDPEGIHITNYEMLHHHRPEDWAGLVLDESSIIKSADGVFRRRLTAEWTRVPFRLACTATPAPNDLMEFGTHAEFLGVMKAQEMLAMFFVHDGGDTSKWRIKGHARAAFWEWMCSWAMMVRSPADCGYENNGFMLPERAEHSHVVETEPHGSLFVQEAAGLMDRRRARRDSIADRVKVAADLVNATDEPFVVWCGLNSESAALTRAIHGAVEVKGADRHEYKRDAMLGFQSGKYRVIVTKPTIAGHGMNWQHCARMVFVGLSDSWEQYYQAVRRCWRFGQTRPVDIHVVTADTEGAVVKNIQRKERQAADAAADIAQHVRAHIRTELKTATRRKAANMERTTNTGEGWTVHLGDCVEVVRGMEPDSIDFGVFSPPFASLYTYTDSNRDMGNCSNDGEFARHFRFLTGELFRVLRPGRLVSFHCFNIPAMKVRDGYIGLKDFRGDLIRMFQAAGFIYHSEVCIWKDPVTAMQRTKALGLLHKQLKKDSAMSRQGIPDYLVTMRKPGENPNPITHTGESFPVEQWQHIASPIWMDIRPNETLQHRSVREDRDERHIAPLQLEVIRRALRLWSNPGDLVLSPFAGIGSEGYVAIELRRRFVGVELKDSYFRQACANLAAAVTKSKQQRLF